MESLKTYFIEVILKKLGPSFIKGFLGMTFVYLGAHQGLLNSLGITWDSQGHTIDIDLDTLSAWALTVGSGGVMAFFSALQHHTEATIKGAPQDGAHQRSTDVQETK